MGKAIKEKERTCWACKRILVEESKLGLCSECLNKYGTPAAAAGAIGICLAGKFLVKNGGKILKFAVKVVKNVRL